MPGIQASKPTHPFFRQPLSIDNSAQPSSDHSNQASIPVQPELLTSTPSRPSAGSSSDHLDQASTSVHLETSGPSRHDSQLGFLTDEDLVNLMAEHSEIQADGYINHGLPTIDESLLQSSNLDETGDDSDYADPPPPEAIPGNISEQFLLTVLARLKLEVNQYNRPKIYSEGTFWIHPRDPVFALDASRFGTDGEQCINPRELYHLDIFVWLPGLPTGSGLPGEPDWLLCPKCCFQLVRTGMSFID